MNFIRNIISEKRAARPEILPSRSVPVEAFVTSDARTDFSRRDGHGAELNIFAAVADEAEINGATEMAEDDIFAFAQDLVDETDLPRSEYQPALDEPLTETADDPWLGIVEPVDERTKAGIAAPLILSDVAEPHSGHEPTSQRSLKDMPFVSASTVLQEAEILTDAGLQMPPPAAGRGASRSGRVKTRLLGFNPDSIANPFERADSKANDTFPVGWLVVVVGPGLGASFSLHEGVSRVGRGEDQTVCLNFGDNSISRENHISIAFDTEQNAFYVGQSGRSNIVRLNNKPLLSTEQVRSGDQIRVGETTLRLVALCGDAFSWSAKS
jgi:FHA domain